MRVVVVSDPLRYSNEALVALWYLHEKMRSHSITTGTQVKRDRTWPKVHFPSRLVCEAISLRWFLYKVNSTIRTCVVFSKTMSNSKNPIQKNRCLKGGEGG